MIFLIIPLASIEAFPFTAAAKKVTLFRRKTRRSFDRSDSSRSYTKLLFIIANKQYLEK